MLPYSAEWAEGDKRLAQIDDDDLANEINELAGPEFLKEVRKAHKLYGEALGMLDPKGPPINLTEPLRTLTRAITHYSLQVIAMLDDSPESTDEVKRALHPFDEHRTESARRSALGSSAPAPFDASTPLPDVS